MSKSSRLVVTNLTLVLALVATITAPARAGLVITEVMSSSGHPGGTSNADWFELTNTGPGAADLTNLTWDDDTVTPGSGHFGGVTSIAVGASLIVTGETIGAEASFRTDWSIPGSVPIINLGGTDFQSFSSAGDQIHIYDGSTVGSPEVLSVTFGAATMSKTFEWDQTGASLGLSVVGENGAYMAPGNGAAGAGVDVGSPGITVVPEPMTAGIVCLASILFSRQRSRRGSR